MTPHRFAASARALAEQAALLAQRYPDADLRRNDVGNLAILHRGEYIGYINLTGGAVCLLEDSAGGVSAG